MMWKNYGNNHTIFDASNGTTPTGVSKNNTNPDVVWSASYPTLMGYNGSNTYGVRVDSSRYADQLKTSRTIAGVSFNGTSNISLNNKDITNGELLAYMDQNVAQKASELGRQQNPSLAGDPDKILMSYK